MPQESPSVFIQLIPLFIVLLVCVFMGTVISKVIKLDINPFQKFIWILLIFFFPLFGALVTLLVIKDTQSHLQQNASNKMISRLNKTLRK